MAVNSTSLVHRTGLVLVVVDIQERLAAAMERRAHVASTASKLVSVATILGAPVIVTRQHPDGLGDTVEELADALEQADAGGRLSCVDKQSFCACDEPEFLEALYETGRSQVVLTGMETHICVTQTALALRSRGYAVHVAADGCSSRREADHETALHRLRHGGVVVTTSESVIYEAVGRAGTDEFRKVLAVVKD